MNHREFQYKIVQIDEYETYWDDKNEEWVDLDRLGKDGWEMIKVIINHDRWMAVFKREIMAPHPKQ